MKINEYNQMMKYLTRRKDPKKPDDYIYDGSKGTIRAEHALSIEANSVHGSDSLENAVTEINFFFTNEEIVG